MNKYLKNSLKVLGVLTGTIAIAAVLQAATLTQIITSYGTNNIVTRPCSITEWQFINAGTQNVTLTLFDAPSTNLTYTGGIYTNMVLTVTKFTNTYTSISGNIVSNVYDVVSNTASVTAAYTNNYPVLATVLVPTNSTITYRPASPIVATHGILATNKDTVSLIISYTPNF